ncbi:DNA polymerase beta superfamily protein [uncultured Schumannella sp.]|uniref:DNA polymerase beta superfamily protein n=1 Tax=uncultured Schumannella sp. TaxID=1195956 RepID=UPI0025EAB9A9|nr:nucleotidyltransferase domain-containing protein [uncultured Schumannella sp.]
MTRFIYIRDRAEYLTPWPRRDVIETPFDKVFGVNGWDLMKALRPLVKGNGPFTERQRSPSSTAATGSFATACSTSQSRSSTAPCSGTTTCTSASTTARGRQPQEVLLRLLPAAVLRWMRDNPDHSVPPMQL